MLRSCLLLVTLFQITIRASAASAEKVPPLPLLIPAGLSLVANPGDLVSGTETNTLNQLLQPTPGNPAEAPVAGKYDPVTGKWEGASYDEKTGQWSPNLTLNPGDGAFLFSPSPVKLTVGDNLRRPPRPLALPESGRALVSRVTQPSRELARDCGLALQPGDTISIWVVTRYETYTYVGAPEKAWTPRDPVVRVGEAFWISRRAVHSIPRLPPALVDQPEDQEISPGSRARFSVKVISFDRDEKLTFQWYRNGKAIPNANGSQYLTPPVTQENQGDVYYIQVESPGGVIKSREARLLLVGRPGVPLRHVSLK